MKKLNQQNQMFTKKEILNRDQLKNVLGGRVAPIAEPGNGYEYRCQCLTNGNVFSADSFLGYAMMLPEVCGAPDAPTICATVPCT